MEMSKYMVVKSNRIIEAKYHLSLNEQKFLLYMIARIDSYNQEDFKLQRVKTSELEAIFATDGKWGGVYSYFRDLVKGIGKKPLEIETEEGNKLITFWVSSVEFKPHESIIEVEFSEKLIPYLLQLKKRFTKYDLDNIIRLKSSFSIRIYELLKASGYKNHIEYKLDELRLKLGVEGKYKDYRDFKKRILVKAQKELETKTDLSFTFEEVKQKRKVVAIIFHIKNQALPPSEKKVEEQPELFPADAIPKPMVYELSELAQVIFDLGVRPKLKAQEICDKGFLMIEDADTRAEAQAQYRNDKDAFLKAKIKLTLAQESKGKKGFSRAGYFIKAVQQNYVSAELLQEQKQAEAKQRRAERKRQAEELKAKQEQLKHAYFNAKTEVIEQLFIQDRSLLPNVLKSLNIPFEEGEERAIFSEDTFTSKMMVGRIRTKIEKNHKDAFAEVREAYKVKFKALNMELP